MGSLFYINFGIAFIFSGIAFYFFWSRYRNQTLTLALKNQQLKAAELENLKQQAENRLLQAQMEPHFLFNTLANIQSLVDIEPKLAKQLIGDLSNMLRASLNYSTQDHCRLSEELEFVRAYLSIQRVRLGDRLIVNEEIQSSLLDETMMPMLIQPLVENAIRHGVEKSIHPVTLTLTVEEDGHHLVIRIEDDHQVVSASDGGFGITLNNIRHRLHNRYGERATIVSRANANATGWVSELRIPREG
jgi:sensor histidine kinase YesM